MRSRPPKPWYRDPRVQQTIYLVASSLIVAGIVYFFYNQQVASVTPPATPTPGVQVTVIAPTAAPSTAPSGVTPAPSPAARRSYTAPFPQNVDMAKTYLATIDTSKGKIVAQINPQDAPLSANNFINLSRDGFYDGLTFHRVEPWVLQGGDPNGTGTGGPGYRFNDEPVKGEYTAGALAMANSGPNTNGSQFFIIKQDTPLPKQYNLFGRVIEGQDVVNRMAIGDKMDKITITEG